MTVLSTHHIPGDNYDPKQVTSVKWKNRDGTSSIIPCPAAFAEYNAIMEGVDRLDHLRTWC